jgi:hypothetical protein
MFASPHDVDWVTVLVYVSAFQTVVSSRGLIEPRIMQFRIFDLAENSGALRRGALAASVPLEDYGFRPGYRATRNSVLALSKKLKSTTWAALMG